LRGRDRTSRIIQDQIMPAYAVFEPPMRKRSAADHADRFIFFRERFNLAAFLFGPLWMVWRRLWLVLIIYLVTVAVLVIGLLRIGIGPSACAAVVVLIQLLVGMEAASLRRWTLIRRGWRDCGIVIADDLELAERRFFDARSASTPSARERTAIPAAPPMASAHMPPSGPEVIGLFPEPGGG
jgi:hypothetical protein